MRQKYVKALVCASLLLSLGCGPHPTPEERRAEANTPAGKLGQAAHKASVEVDKAGRVLGRKLDQAAREAHQGWKEAERKDREKKQ